MMVLGGIARERGVFDRLAILAVRAARDSASRLFAIVFGVATVITVFLSNDAAAVVLTPAVARAAKRGNVPPLPHLFACAFVANAASFVLPISNPANLVMYGAHLPALGAWVVAFALPSLVALAVTFVVLRALMRNDLHGSVSEVEPPAAADASTKRAIVVLVVACVALVVASFLGLPLGLTTLLLGAIALGVTARFEIAFFRAVIGGVDWPVLALTAGLFAGVGLLRATPAIAMAAALVGQTTSLAPVLANLVVGGVFALACNIANNLPVGLIARAVADHGHESARSFRAIVVAVDLGPNIAAHASLATLLWLSALRREGVHVTALGFLRVGIVVGTLSLIAALLVT